MLLLAIIFSGCAKQDRKTIVVPENSPRIDNINNVPLEGEPDIYDKSIIVSENKVQINDYVYRLYIIQTKYKKPPVPGEKNFDMYNSAFYGAFDIVTLNNNNKEVDRLNLNQFFKQEDIGFIGKLELKTVDYNKDGNLDFAIGQPAKDGTFKYVVFSIEETGKLRHLPVKDDYIYNISSNHTAEFVLNEAGNGIKVAIPKPEGGGYKKAEYVWEDEQFTLAQ